MSTVAEFTLDLEAFGVAVEADATAVLREAAELTAEAIALGNQYGPGAPVDTGFLRASFRASVGAPASGPTTAPRRQKRRPGSAPVAAPTFGPALASATLDQPLYITTNVGYAQFLELLERRRRYGRFAGQSTVFVRPVELRWPRIVEDTMRRLGVGDPSAPPS